MYMYRSGKYKLCYENPIPSIDVELEMIQLLTNCRIYNYNEEVLN